MTSPGAPEVRCRLHDQEKLWPMSAHSLRMLHKAGPCLCSAREDSQSDNVQDPASSNPPVSAALVLPPSYLVSACSSWLQTEAANDSELSSHECSLIRDLILDLQDLTCQPSRHTKSLYDARIQTYLDSSATAGQECAASADVRASPHFSRCLKF